MTSSLGSGTHFQRDASYVASTLGHITLLDTSCNLQHIVSISKMQRPSYGQPPIATSPPLHHPVPQHVSTVPQLRSPPPPVPQQPHGAYGGSPYQPQQGTGNGAHAFGPYGGFMNDQTAQMGLQVGQTAFKHGQEYVEQNVNLDR